MAVDVRDVPAVEPSASVPVRTHGRRAWFLWAFAVWNVWVWGTRMANLIGDGEEHSVAFIAVHVVLYVMGFGGAAVLAVMGWRMRREVRDARQASA